jgi:hypothetical protein
MDNVTVELTPEELAYIREAIKRTRKAAANTIFALRDVEYDDLTDNQIWEVSFYDNLGQLGEKLNSL